MLIIVQIILGSLIFITGTFSFAKTYTADFDRSEWTVKDSSIECRLIHEIPGFGVAEFYQTAGERQKFALKTKVKQYKPVTVKITANPPFWEKYQSKIELAKITSRPGKTPIELFKNTSYEIQNFLQKGYDAEFTFYGSDITSNNIARLSKTGFQKPYQNYLACINEIVPYKFSQIENLVIYFASAKDFIEDEYLAKIAAIGKFVMLDSQIKSVHIESHTDGKGSYHDNKKLAYERSWTVKDELVYAGVPPQMITLKNYVDTKPVASNATKDGRALNRRVIVKVKR